jgi:hypothetical protein
MSETLSDILRGKNKSFEQLPSGILIQSNFIPDQVGCIFVYNHQGITKVELESHTDFLLASGDIWYGCFEHQDYKPKKGEPTKRKLPYEHLPCCLKDLDIIALSNGRFLSKKQASPFSTRYLRHYEGEGREVSGHFAPYNPLEVTEYLARNIPLMGITEDDLTMVLDDMSSKMGEHISPVSHLELLGQ